MKQQCNLHRLEDVDFSGCNIPVSTLLKDAPLLRHISLKSGKKIDDEAVEGISTGVLGRCLRKLDLRCYASDIEKILTMLEARQKRVKMQVERGCRLESEFTGIKEVTLQIDTEEIEEIYIIPRKAYNYGRVLFTSNIST